MIIIAVIAIIIATAGYFALTRKAVAPAAVQEPKTTNKTAELPNENLATKDWKIYIWGNFRFGYPDNWITKDEYYTTPAGYTEKVAVIISPPNKNSPNDFITIGGRQVNCGLMIANDSHCVEVSNMPIHTISKNSKIIQIFELTVKKTREINK